MAARAIVEQAQLEGWSDEQIVGRVLGGEPSLYELLMRRHNQRLYRIARAILQDDGEAEDVMQEAYVRAYRSLANFQGRAKFVTWLTRIAVNEALARARKRARLQPLDAAEEGHGDIMESVALGGRSPEQEAYGRELAVVLEQAILTLNEDSRVVFILREVEGLSTAETAQSLDMTEENVKVRLHRARARLRHHLEKVMGESAAQCFQFQAARCDRVVSGVFRTLNLPTF